MARILKNPEIIKPLPTSSVKFPMPILTAPLSNKFFSFNKFVNNLNLDLFLTKSNRLPCKCNKSPFADRNHEYIVTMNLQFFKTLFTKTLDDRT